MEENNEKQLEKNKIQFDTKEKFNIIEFLCDNRALIYPILFYISGLILGSSTYKVLDNGILSPMIEEVCKGSSGGFLQLFVNNLGLYLTVFCGCVLLGLCIIGFSIVNFIPLICGFEIAVKISYFYVNYNVKGVGYSLLILVPGIVLFMTIIMYTIELSNVLSKYIYNIATKKSGVIKEFNLKSYLIRFGLYALLVIVASALSALLNYLLSSLISL